MDMDQPGLAFISKCSMINAKLVSDPGKKYRCLEERFASLIEAIDEYEYDFLYQLEFGEKRSDKSKILRLEGNRYFQSTEKGSLDKAVEEYTKAVAHAPNGSEDLGLAYANRSAALFKARLISDCLLDIGRALENNYPDNLKAKLFLRKAMCLQILESNNDSAIKDAFNEVRKWTEKMDEKNQRIMKKKLEEQEHAKSIDKSTFSKWPYQKFVPKLDAENPIIPGLSDAVELKYSEKYGRHMVATRDIKPGEVLCVQKPFAKVVYLNSRYHLCWNCGEQIWASLPCERCVEVVFCSEACREEGNREHHGIECSIIKCVFALGAYKSFPLQLRILVKAFREANGSFETLKKNIEEIDAEKNPLLKGFKNGTLDPSKFSSIYSLTSECCKQVKFEASAYALLVASLLATKTNFFGLKLNGDLKKLQRQKNFIFIAALLEKILLITSCNQNEASMQVYEKKTYHMIVPVYSFFNHSCFSMIETMCQGNYLTNTAIVPVKKGQQIFCSYSMEFTDAPRNVRQENYLEYYGFNCECEACENNWPQEAIYGFENLKLEDNFLVNKLLQNSCDLNEKLSMAKIAVKLFGPKHGEIYDSKKDIDDVVKIIEKLYSLGLKPCSLEISTAISILADLLTLNENRYLSLN